VINITGVIAPGFSPSKIVKELEIGEESCQMITVNSDSAISISDKWAEDEEVEWKVGLFDTSAEEHGININYDNELSEDERELEVCMSGERAGEYHGVLLLREEQKGNSIVQMGVWIKLVVVEEVIDETNTNDVNTNEGSGGSGGSSPVKTINTIENEVSTSVEVDETNEANRIDENIEDNSEKEVNKELINAESRPGITGAVIGTVKQNLKIIFSVLLVIIIVGAIIYNKRKTSEVSNL